MLGITMRDRHRSTWIRAKTKVKDIVLEIKQKRWRWVGNLVRMNDNRWTKRITDWFPYND